MPGQRTGLTGSALTRTLFRPADVPRAMQPLLSRGEVVREPERGRLTATTVIQVA